MGGPLSLLPALVTIGVALSLRRVSLALLAGVLTGVAVVGAGPTGTLLGALKEATQAALELERLKIVAFILLVGGLLEVLAVSGAYRAFAESLGRRINSPRRARMAAWGVSCSLFFDDYANVLISGSSLRGVAQRNGVRPAMMAYLVDVVAVLASVMLVSTWAAFEGAILAKEAEAIGVTKGMSELFLGSLPYHFYTYLGVFLTLLVAWTGRWFGAGWDTQDLPSEGDGGEGTEGARPSHVLVPVLTLVLGALVGLFGVGFWKVQRAGHDLTLMAILGAAPAVDVLIGATLLAILVAVVLFKRGGLFGRFSLPPAFARGVRDMLEIGIIILLATALSHLTSHLGAGTYLARLVTQALSPGLVPLAMFLLASLVTVCTGFSWGSMAIVMPVAFALATTDPGRLVPILSAAVITGAVSGEHLIPFSEKAVLSATACGISPVYHFQTHIFQSLAVVLAAALGFLMVGFGVSVTLALILPAALLLGAHWLWAR